MLVFFHPLFISNHLDRKDRYIFIAISIAQAGVFFLPNRTLLLLISLTILSLAATDKVPPINTLFISMQMYKYIKQIGRQLTFIYFIVSNCYKVTQDIQRK